MLHTYTYLYYHYSHSPDNVGHSQIALGGLHDSRNVYLMCIDDYINLNCQHVFFAMFSMIVDNQTEKNIPMEMLKQTLNECIAILKL